MVIDNHDLSFYPLKKGMLTEEIKAVKREDILAAALKIAEFIAIEYKGTPYYVDMPLAKRILTFITLLRHTGGSLGGVEFRLLPFQVEFIVQTLCVLSHDTGYRKHSEAIMNIPRKNGKSELGAALTLVLYFLDGEQQKEIYSIASETTQAAILFGAVLQMLKQLPALLRRVRHFKAEKKIQTTGGEFVDLYRVLSAEAGTKDGLKTSAVMADEPHAYPDAALYNVVTEGMAHRDQGISFLLSTAGYNKQGFYHRKLLYARQVMQGVIEDPSIYLMDFSLDDDADWTDEALWAKANPALGYGVKMKYLRNKYHKAMHSATDEVSFKTKHLNMWVDSAVTWIKQSAWKASGAVKTYTEADLVGRECYGGLDLASVTDLAAFALIFPIPEDRAYAVLIRFFVPEENAMERSKTDKVMYLDWIRDGWITATPGNVIDYDAIYDQILKDAETFDVREIAFDRWNSHGLVTKLEEKGLTMVGFGQGYQSMSSPVKEVETLVLQKKLQHGNNPVLTWNVANCVTVSDAADNVKLDKSKAVEKIDGAVAMVMGVGRAAVYKDETPDFDSLIG